MLTRYADDKFEDQKCEVVIFLLETKEQMKLISSTCNYRFALITKGGGSNEKHSLNNNIIFLQEVTK